MTRHGWRIVTALCVLCGLLAGCQSASRDIRALPPIDTEVGDLADVRESDRAAPADSGHSMVMLVSHQEPSELPAPEPREFSSATPEVIQAASPLELREVVVSVLEAYPLLRAAFLERNIAAGGQLSAWGEFDTDVKAFSISTPLGFYENYRNALGVEQPLFRGGFLYGGYKIGDGDFQPWYKERETDEGGEFSAGFGLPLLKDRTIDKRRAEVFKADLVRQGVEPAVQAQTLEFVRAASQAYWKWIAAGQSLAAERELLQNAQDRVRQIEAKVGAGDLARIARINNEQLIAARETKVIESERKLQEAAIKLSLFLRNSEGEPIIPAESRLPPNFPAPLAPDHEQVERDIAAALAASPFLNELDILAEQVQVDLRNAQNMMLPKLDALVGASKEVGAPASSRADKTPFELEAGLIGEVPLQRREARGKITSSQGKLAQIAAKRRFVVNKITAGVQDAVSALQAARGRIERAETNLQLARETLELGRIQFDAGDIDLVSLNIYEKAVTDAQLLLISAQADFFTAVADYRAVLALDPLPLDEPIE